MKDMVVIRQSIVVILVALSLAGCSGISQVKDTISKYNQGIHSVSSTEMNFFRSAQSAECTADFYGKANRWARGVDKNPNIDGICMPQSITDERIKVHQATMDKITLYADTMKALISSDNDRALNLNSKELVNRINSILRTCPIFNLSAGSDIEMVIVNISQMGLNQRKINEVKAAAQKMEPYLERVIKRLEKENIIVAQGINTHLAEIRKDVEQLLKKDKQKGIVRFLNFVQARRIVQSANPFGMTPVSRTKGAMDPQKDPLTVALNLNKALEAVITANKALTSADNGNIAASINDLVLRAHTMESIQKTSWNPFFEILQYSGMGASS
jgi:hypothetical protein